MKLINLSYEDKIIYKAKFLGLSKLSDKLILNSIKRDIYNYNLPFILMGV